MQKTTSELKIIAKNEKKNSYWVMLLFKLLDKRIHALI